MTHRCLHQTETRRGPHNAEEGPGESTRPMSFFPLRCTATSPWSRGQGAARLERARNTRKQERRSSQTKGLWQLQRRNRRLVATKGRSPPRPAPLACAPARRPARVSLYGQMTRRGFSGAGARGCTPPADLPPLSLHSPPGPLDPGPTVREHSCRRPGHGRAGHTGIAT